MTILPNEIVAASHRVTAALDAWLAAERARVSGLHGVEVVEAAGREVSAAVDNWIVHRKTVEHILGPTPAK